MRKTIAAVEPGLTPPDEQPFLADVARKAGHTPQSGHEMVVTHDDDIAIYTAVCLNGDGADCRLVCSEGCEEWPAITRDSDGAFHGVYSHDGSLVECHRMLDAGECQAVLWLEQDPGTTPELAEDRFEIGRFPIHLVQTENGIKWQRSV